MDGSLAVTVGLLDSMAQDVIFGGFAEHDAPAVLLLKGFVRSHRLCGSTLLPIVAAHSRAYTTHSIKVRHLAA